jgi:colanic acid biosynthesis protein WcaH
MFLDDGLFSKIIESTPLISIDLVIRNSRHEVLLGRRNNRPARGYWFVPGGRIQKNESLKNAFLRLTEQELGESLSIDSAKIINVYDHFYTDSVFGDYPSTHYVAVAYELEVNRLDHLPLQQHSDYAWFTIADISSSEFVHKHTKAYFLSKD